jgi:hypothetical protein
VTIHALIVLFLYIDSKNNQPEYSRKSTASRGRIKERVISSIFAGGLRCFGTMTIPLSQTLSRGGERNFLYFSTPC